tara:strand:- start:304 stop:654 length:351 start_codon:yes stop_codon:yes gene_type:complete
MKRLLLVLLPIGLFVFSCEDNNVVDTSEGVKLEWIGFGGRVNYSSLEYVFYVGNIPSFPQIGTLYDTDYDGWNYSYECDEIELFQSEGYFNFILSANPNLILTYRLDEFYDPVWKE